MTAVQRSETAFEKDTAHKYEKSSPLQWAGKVTTAAVVQMNMWNDYMSHRRIVWQGETSLDLNHVEIPKALRGIIRMINISQW